MHTKEKYIKTTTTKQNNKYTNNWEQKAETGRKKHMRKSTHSKKGTSKHKQQTQNKKHREQ